VEAAGIHARRQSTFGHATTTITVTDEVEVSQISPGSSWLIRLALSSLVFLGFRWCVGVRGLKFD
jgi:hypothetical protein